MKKIIDEVFGEMTYRYAWEKEAKTSLWGNDYQLRITASDLDEEGISSKQRQTYKSLWANLEQILSDNDSLLLQYLRESLGGTSNEPTQLHSFLTPKTLLIQQNGDWGILFDSTLDVEHGVALYSENNRLNVGPQDDFL
ncbi:DUF6985 domain-containing protein [Vibrio diabolicus]|uniref:DUF6985 domain-containing protein n=1 Tax=Vibrio diabolicus TaxID=50719 RepID=UPI0024958EFE|nr:hypothetical protein [Vibrio diabolicus]